MGLTDTLQAVNKKTDDLYAVVLSDDVEIIFRLPPFKKAQQYSQLLSICGNDGDTNIVFEHIFRECVEDSWVETAEDIPAGIVPTVSKLILFFSSFNDSPVEYTQGLLDTYRAQIGETSSFLKRMICSAFGGYTFEALEELNFHKLVYLYVQAEQILLERGIIQGEYNFTNPEDQNKKAVNDIHSQIRKDQLAYEAFNNPQADLQRKQMTEKLREEAIEKAKEEERQFRNSLKGG